MVHMLPLIQVIPPYTTLYIPVSTDRYKFLTIHQDKEGNKNMHAIGLRTYAEVQAQFATPYPPKTIEVDRAFKCLDLFSAWIGNAMHYLENPPGTLPRVKSTEQTKLAA